MRKKTQVTRVDKSICSMTKKVKRSRALSKNARKAQSSREESELGAFMRRSAPRTTAALSPEDRNRRLEDHTFNDSISLR